MRIQVNKFPNTETYRNGRFEFFKKVEGFVPRVYTDEEGLPTLGIGHKLLVEQKGALIVKPGWLKELQIAGMDVKEVDPAASTRILAEIAGALNRHTKDSVQEAQAIIPPLSKNEVSQALNVSGLPLITENQGLLLFDKVIEPYRIPLARKLGPSLVKHLDGSHEMIALLSLAYVSPTLIGPGLVRSLMNNDRAETWFQIRYYSNRENSLRLAKRRYYEAFTFNLYDHPGPPPKVEAKNVLKMSRRRMPLIEKYEAQFQHLIPEANTHYNLTPPNTIATLHDELEPARAAC